MRDGAPAANSMRERVGSRRASFMDYAESGSIFTQDAPSTLQPAADMIAEDAETASAVARQPEAPAASVAVVDDKGRNRMAGRHGLVKWVLAGDVRLWLVGACFYPMAQITRIMSDYFIRWWTEGKFGLSQGDNLAIYSYLVAGFILGLVLRDFFFFRFSVLSAAQMRRDLSAAIMQAPMMFFMTENLGPLTGVFTRDLDVVSEELADAIHMGSIYLMILLTTMGLISVQIPYFAIASVILLVTSALIQRRYSKKVAAARLDFQKCNDDVFHTLSDSLEGVKVLRTANETTWSIDLLTEAFKASRVSTVANEKCTLWLTRRADCMGVVLSFLTCLLCVVLEIAPAARGLAISNSLQILVFYSWMMRNVSAAIYSSGSVDRIYEYVSSIPQERREGQPLDKAWPHKGAIEFDNITLKYAPSLPSALDAVSFKLPHAAKVGVVGRTGSGKSTLLVALFRLIQPCDGSIVLSDKNTLLADLDALRNQLSIVPQEPAMFAGNLRENIDPLNRYPDAAVIEVVKQCGLGG